MYIPDIDFETKAYTIWQPHVRTKFPLHVRISPFGNKIAISTKLMELERSGHIPTFSFSLPSLRRTTATFSLPPFLRRKLKPPKGVFPLLFDDGSRQSGAEELRNQAVSPSKPSVASRGGGHRERCSAKHSCFMLRRKGKCRRRRNFCKKNLLRNWQLTNLLF